ncbi:telomerase RNA component interacting RNase [Genypterus blacodes]|uniref:telomerase RNA component interacting RNase n=1 Tax=Genypterus blacodes TaxID=154954 RepID=UPI003F762476
MDSTRTHPDNPQTSSTRGDSSSGSDPASPAGSPGQEAAAGPGGGNVFANDGSFMEMFKKKMEEAEKKRNKEVQQQQHTGGDARATEQGQSTVGKKPPPVTSFVGKRRGGVFLKTGMVAKKQKEDGEGREPGKSDAWSKYMAEVKKYKAHQCGDDDKTRPLVK